LQVLSLEIARINSSKKEASPPALSFREGVDDDKKKYLTNLFTNYSSEGVYIY